MRKEDEEAEGRRHETSKIKKGRKGFSLHRSTEMTIVLFLINCHFG